jgi:putative transposase
LQLANTDRWLWALLSRIWTGWRTTLVIVKPETVIAWHRRGFRRWWAWKSQRRRGRATVPADVRTLIRTMALANPRRGAPQIHGELLKLGIDICQATVARYRVRRRLPPLQTWRTCLRNHVGQVVASEFFVLPTATYRLLFVFVLLAHDRRRMRHVAVTAHPTAAWTAQQLREAFPWDATPRYLVHDRDHAFESLGTPAKLMGIEEVHTASRAPWQNAFVERFIGSARRECLDHMIVLNEAGLRKLMTLYCSYYERSRTLVATQGDTDSSSGHAARRGRCRGDPGGRRPPSIRTPRGLNARQSPARRARAVRGRIVTVRLPQQQVSLRPRSKVAAVATLSTQRKLSTHVRDAVSVCRPA